ncbi:MAG: hypothetical protein GX663_05915 [Clostridiales bacterium]|nr:hypothetical protein [Clostridiales bacterium]
MKEKAGELFGVDYYYEIEGLGRGEGISPEEYEKQAEGLYKELEKCRKQVEQNEGR